MGNQQSQFSQRISIGSEKLNESSFEVIEIPYSKYRFETDGEMERSYYQNERILSLEKSVLDEEFEKYAKNNEIGESNLAYFIGCCGVEDLSDIRALWICWKFHSKNLIITKEHFISTMTQLQCDSVNDLKNKIPQNPLGDKETFNKLFSYCFEANIEDGHKRIELPIAFELLLLFYPKTNQRLRTFFEFANKTKVQSLSKDEWNCLIDLIEKTDDFFVNYDENSSPWPLLFDDFISFMNKH